MHLVYKTYVIGGMSYLYISIASSLFCRNNGYYLISYESHPIEQRHRYCRLEILLKPYPGYLCLNNA